MPEEINGCDTCRITRTTIYNGFAILISRGSPPMFRQKGPRFRVHGIANGNASGSWDTRYQFAEDLTYVYPGHSLKGGVSGIKSLLDTPFVPGFGNFNFDGRFTGEPFADFLLGLPGTFTRTLRRAAIARRIWEYGIFAQDDWRISPRLTLSYGLRWDHFTAPYDKNDQYFNFDFPTGKIVVPDQRALSTVNPAFRTDLVPVVLSSSIGYPEKLTNPTDRFLPRFGVVRAKRTWAPVRVTREILWMRTAARPAA